MMKRLTFIVLSLLMITPLFAQVFPQKEEEYLSYSSSENEVNQELLWGVLYDYSRNYDKYYGLDLVLKTGGVAFSITEDGIWQKPTNVSNKEVALKNEMENGLNATKRQEDLANIITKAFRVWFEDTKAEIEKKGRQEEFKDIMPILNKAVKPSRNKRDLENAKKYHAPILHFYFTTQNNMLKLCKVEWAGGCKTYKSDGAEIILVNPYTNQRSDFFTKNQTYRILIHEIGHYYGLSDQYKLGANNTDNEYSTEDRVRDFSSVMASGDFTHLTCDDIDGFINLIDLTLSKQNHGKFSARARGGWASFCNGKKSYKNTYYKNAKPVNKKTDDCVYDVSSEGKVGKKYCPKLWTFHRKQDKLTYGKNSLISEKQDEKFNYKYSYVRQNGAPAINVLITSSGIQHTSTKKNFNNKNMKI